MLICRFLSFSLFLCAFIPTITCYQPKINECELQQSKEATPVIEQEQEVKNNDITSPNNEDPPVDLETSCEDINLGDESISQIVDTFVQSIEGFWQETRRNLNEYRKRKLPPGQWWLKEVETDYRAMKENFFSCLSPDTPQHCLEILADYEVRYNDIMWAELEKEIKRIQSLGESDDEDVGDTKDISLEELSQSRPFNYAEERLGDTYSAVQEKEMNTFSASDGQVGVDTKGVCKRLSFEEVMFEGPGKKVTPLYCGEGTPNVDRTAD